ncbi:peptidoglycan-binding protein [Alicyclobacillus macrosporangiidus]
MAFGSLFATWHHIAATAPSLHASSTKSPVLKPLVPQPNQSDNTGADVEKILYAIGSQGPQVGAIQQQLSLLGYFHHPITQYYGAMTAESVRAFQAEHQLPPTGTIDQNTLTAIQNAVKQARVAGLTQSVSNDPVNSAQPPKTSSQIPHATSPRRHSSVSAPTPRPSSTPVARPAPGSGSARLSHQSKPDATSSGS